MRHKILIADDSLTIQKVIKITLANEPFDMDVCSQADELASKVQASSPNIVLLDFNLSEEITGYELCKKIKEINSNTKVFMLFGTFDTIDDDQLSDVGCENKIVKPFDGSKFINICRQLADQVASESSSVESSAEVEEEFPEVILNETETDQVEEENWVMDGPEHVDTEPAIIEEPESDDAVRSALDQEVEDWGMSVPGVIDGEDDHMDLPEVIDFSGASNQGHAQLEEVSVEMEEESTFPKSSELEYPEIDKLRSDDSSDELPCDGPKLTPISDLNLDALPDEEDGPEEVDLVEEEEESEGEGEGTDSEEALQALEAQIQDELEDSEEPTIQNVNLWSYDEVDDSDEVSSELPEIKPYTLEKVEDTDLELESTPEDFPSDIDYESELPSQEVSSAAASAALGEFKIDAEFEEKLKEQLKPLVEEYVKQYSKSMIEKVAWEVIPDLAENLIKKEIKRISESIISP